MARARTAKTSSKPTAKVGVAPGFDLLVLTVANRVQQRYAERMLDMRRRLGALPAGLTAVVLADPAGKRIGSGGSTILCMAALAKRGLLRGRRILVLHSGGDSRRLPAWSAAGKIWVPLERLGRGIGPMGSPALFDLAFAELSRLSLPASGGVLVASGDAALRLKGERVEFGARHATVLAFPGDAERASRHGVFVLDRSQRVIRTLQKPSPAALRDAGALNARGRAMIDSGIFFFPTKACETLLRGAAPMIPALARGTASLDLYQEIAESMAKSSTAKEFVARFAGTGSAGTTSSARRAKQLSAFHAAAHGIALHASLLRSGSFLHLGTTRELAERLASREAERMFPDLLHARSAGANVQHVSDEHIGVRIGRSGGLPAKLAAFDVPLAAGRHCAVVHGIDDDCKTAATDGGTFCGKPLRALPARTGLTTEAIWGTNPHTLWHARIFPVGTRRASHDATQWMVRGTKSTPAWQRMPRASLAEVMLRADAEELATLHAHALLHAPWAPRKTAPLAVARRYAALEAIASTPEERAEARIHAMAAIGAAVERDIALPRPVTTFAVRQDQAVWASAPVRIDLAGGWSDTPPLCIEHGGAVVNAAVTLGGTLPLQAMVRVTEEPTITLHSVDAGRTAQYRSVRQLLDHRDPSQWDALPRAALILSGLVPREPGADLRAHLTRAGGGLAITLFSAVPRGSGLGTSSILGATLLATLDRIAGHATDPAHIARGASLLEQMISTRGGWQDQVGGLWGGIKLCTTRAGIHQVPDVAPIAPPASFTRALHERAVLLYSGQRRMARGILETVVMRYLRGERAVLEARARLVDGAHAMAAAVAAGDVDEFGRRLAEYRELKRTVDPASVTPLLEAPIDALGRDVASWSFAGAGGGGFVILMCRSAGAAERGPGTAEPPTSAPARSAVPLRSRCQRHADRGPLALPPHKVDLGRGFGTQAARGGFLGATVQSPLPRRPSGTGPRTKDEDMAKAQNWTRFIAPAAIAALALAPAALASEADLQLPPIDDKIVFSVFGKAVMGATLMYAGIGVALLGALFGLVQYMQVNALPVHPAMRNVSNIIWETCKSYLGQQGKFLALLWFLIAGAMVVYFGFLNPIGGGHGEGTEAAHVSPAMSVGIVLLCSILGILGSYGVAWFGIRINTQANSRTAFASLQGDGMRTLSIPLQSGMSIGMLLVSVELFFMIAIMMFIPANLVGASFIGFAIGESLGATVLRICGGIFTKIADIGSDLMKIVFKLPEDDPKNPGVIADCTGDNAGDSVGPTADGFETYGVTGVALIAFLAYALGGGSADQKTMCMQLIVWLFTMRALMIITSLVSYFITEAWSKASFGGKKDFDQEAPLTRLVIVTSIISIIATFFASHALLDNLPYNGKNMHSLWWILASIISLGTAAGALIPEFTKVFTSTSSKHVNEVTNASAQGGASLNILSGFVAGNYSAFWTGLLILVLMACGWKLSGNEDITLLMPDAYRDFAAPIFAFGLIAFGFLGMGPVTIAVDSFGPVTDNAQSVFELSRIEALPNIKEELKRDYGIHADFEQAKLLLEKGDGAGNTFKATAKPVLIGTAVVGATTMIFGIILALSKNKMIVPEGKSIEGILSIVRPEILLGLLMGGAVIYWFTGAATQAVVTGAYSAVVFIKKNINLDKAEASIQDSKEVVKICTIYAQKGMWYIFLAVFCLSLGLPFFSPVFFIGYLIGIAFFGLFQAIFMANAGGAWDNAKKIVEVDMRAKGTDLHAATVVGDTVGDPFKDTSSVSLNPVIKFTTLFGLLAVEIVLTIQSESLKMWIGLALFTAALYFIWGSFYKMRIPVDSKD